MTAQNSQFCADQLSNGRHLSARELWAFCPDVTLRNFRIRPNFVAGTCVLATMTDGTIAL